MQLQSKMADGWQVPIMTSLHLFTVSYQLTGETGYCCIYVVIKLFKFDIKAVCHTLQTDNGDYITNNAM